MFRELQERTSGKINFLELPIANYVLRLLLLRIDVNFILKLLLIPRRILSI